MASKKISSLNLIEGVCSVRELAATSDSEAWSDNMCPQMLQRSACRSVGSVLYWASFQFYWWVVLHYPTNKLFTTLFYQTTPNISRTKRKEEKEAATVAQHVNKHKRHAGLILGSKSCTKLSPKRKKVEDQRKQNAPNTNARFVLTLFKFTAWSTAPQVNNPVVAEKKFAKESASTDSTEKIEF